MLGIILASIVTVVLSVGFLLLFQDRNNWKQQYFALYEEQQNINEARIQAERKHERSENDLEYLKQTVNYIMSRPVLATLTDVQANNLAQTIVQYLRHMNIQDLSKMN